MILLGIMRSMLLSAICMHLPVHFAFAIERFAAAHPVLRFLPAQQVSQRRPV